MNVRSVKGRVSEKGRLNRKRKIINKHSDFHDLMRGQEEGSDAKGRLKDKGKLSRFKGECGCWSNWEGKKPGGGSHRKKVG